MAILTFSRRPHVEEAKSRGLQWAVLNREPPIVLLDVSRDAVRLFEPLAGHRAFFLAKFPWYAKDSGMVSATRLLVSNNRAQPHHELHFMCNSPAETAWLREENLRAFTCSNNSLIDASLFAPSKRSGNRFVAIYDARLTPFKRHPLARAIRELALITFVHPTSRSRRYELECRRVLDHATWINGPFSSCTRFLSPRKVCAVLQESRVGLMLSCIEGANYATLQYLLCGLPVVSTPSLGGRDVFFTPWNSRVVDPDPQAILRAVQELAREAPPPEIIRSEALKTVTEHRNNLNDVVTAMLDRAGVKRPFVLAPGSRHAHKVVRRLPAAQLKDELLEPDVDSEGAVLSKRAR